jgi:hypothetical protein
MVRPLERTKLTGAITVEVLREHLRNAGVPVSSRDVFMNGNPTEFDLFVVRPNARPKWGIIYDPRDVAAVMEIKFSGAYGQGVTVKLQSLFNRIRSDHPHIQCVYLAIAENPKYKHRIIFETLGFPAFTLNWWNHSRTEIEPGDTIEAVVSCLQQALEVLPVHSD